MTPSVPRTKTIIIQRTITEWNELFFAKALHKNIKQFSLSTNIFSNNIIVLRRNFILWNYVFSELRSSTFKERIFFVCGMLTKAIEQHLFCIAYGF